MYHRREFSKEVRRAAFARCGGACEHCTVPLADGGIIYDHVVAYLTKTAPPSGLALGVID